MLGAKKTDIIVKVLRLIGAVAVSFLLFTSIPYVRGLFGIKRPALKQQRPQPRIIAEVVRIPPIKEPQTVKTLREMSAPLSGPSGSRVESGLSLRITPDLSVEGSGGAGIALQGQDLETMVFDEGQTDENVVPLHTPSIAYPQRAQELGIQGTLEAVITIDRNGSVAKIEIVKSPHPSIAEEAKRVIASWRFKPARIKGIPVKVRRMQKIDFKLDD